MDFPSARARTTSVLLAATAVLIIGTAWIDLGRVPLLLVPLSFLMAAYSAGEFLQHGRGESEKAREFPICQLTTRLGTGLACLSLLVVTAALCGVLRFTVVVLIPLVALGAWVLFHTLCELRPSRQLLKPALAGLVLGIAWLVAWLWATIPPTFFDELAYHLAIPQRAIATGTLQAIPWVFFTLMPHASDLLLGWGMAVAGDLGARATHFSAWVLCSLAAWALADAIAEPHGSPWIPTIVVGALATSPMLWFLATLPFAELWLTTAVLVSCVMLVTPGMYSRPWLFLGLMLWLVGAVKLSGLFWIAALLAAALVLGWSWKELSKAGAVMLAGMSLWWARAAYYTGNPIYPMAYLWLGGTGWSDESQARVMGDMVYGSGGLGVLGVLRLPWDMVRYPERFASAGDAGIVAVTATCLLVALPIVARLAACGPETRRRMDAAAVFMLIAGVCWLLTTPTTRYFAPALVIGLTGLAGACFYLRPTGRIIGVLVLGAGALWGMQGFMAQHAFVFSSFQVALGRETGEAFLTRQLDHFKAARFVRDTLPKDARLLFVGETRPYYFAREAVAPSAYDSHPLYRWVQESSSPDGLTARLAAEGITHVVLNIREFHRLHEKYGLLTFSGERAEENDRRLKSLPQALSLLFKDNGVYVFEVPELKR